MSSSGRKAPFASQCRPSPSFHTKISIGVPARHHCCRPDSRCTSSVNAPGHSKVSMTMEVYAHTADMPPLSAVPIGEKGGVV